MALLEAKRLSARYGRARILFDISLEANAGEVVVLLGRNGAGKSTTLKAIMGLVPPAGELFFGGRRIDRLEPFEIARLGLGYVPEDRRIFTDLTVAENLEVGRRPERPGAPAWTMQKLIALFPSLRALQDRLGARMSGGEQQMLSIARTLAGNPRAILLDEPSEGLAPLIVDDLVRAIQALKRAGVSILLCEQNLSFARRVADRAYVLERGHVVHSGGLSGLESDPRLHEEYLSP